MAAGNPADARTNSGTAVNLLSALAKRVDIAGIVSSQPSKQLLNLIRLATFAPTKSAWRSRWRLTMRQVHASRAAARSDLAGISPDSFDALLQMGTYCSVADVVKQPIFVYIDHDLPALVQLDPRMRGTSMQAGYVRRRIAHEREVLASCAGVFTFSEWCRERVIADYGLPAHHVVAAGAGSNIDERLLEREPAYGAQHAVMLGFDFERKGGPDVLSAFDGVRRVLPHARLTIIGGLPPGEPQPGVTSTGPLIGAGAQQRIADIFASASLYVMPSRFEPFGVAFIEAMAAGLPCIGADVCAMPEIIGDSGAIVPLRDATALARAIVRFLSDEETCRRHGHAARERYRRCYGWNSVAARMVDVMFAKQAVL
jgi:glycosyltransferase involved in cell wall biosynthesis